MNENKLLAILALQAAPGIGDITAKKLIAQCGSPEAIFSTSKRSLEQIDGIGSFISGTLSDVMNFKKAEKELSYIQKNKIQCHYFEDSSYPKGLKHCADGPILLFSSGNIQIQNQPVVSIVGTRRASVRGTMFCEQLIEQLSTFNPIIASGFAYGIDITAHKTAMKYNLQTLACLAHGIQKCYPSGHIKYRKQIEANGGFYSDFWSDTLFEKSNFVKRNRIIAGLSSATIVIESSERGGSLITADMAFDYNREVFAVPGRPSDKMSQGCNNLIKIQKAHVLTSATDIISHLNWEEKKSLPSHQKKLFVELSDNEQVVLSSLQKSGNENLDEIALSSQKSISEVATILFGLELKGLVRALPGKSYEAI